MRAVPAFEIILHRIVWSFVLLLPLIIMMRRWQEFIDALKNTRTLLILFFTALIVGSNWLLYIGDQQRLPATGQPGLLHQSPGQCGAGCGFS